MPSWNDVLAEIKTAGSVHDVIRRKYLAKLHEVSGRNVIVYYSGWLQKSAFTREAPGILEVNDNDKNGFMAAVYGLDRDKGLDLLLHTPGGDIAATESLIDYLRSMFGTNIRVIVPQIAMSAGTMIACAAQEVVLGKHSNLGPVDPQIMGVAAHAILEEFDRAATEIRQDNTRMAVWQPIIAKYSPTLVGECERASKWAKDICHEALVTGMFAAEADPAQKADEVLAELGDHSKTMTHSRHISRRRAEEIGLKIVELESNPDLQDAVLTVHHACIQTLSETPAAKLIENHEGIAFINTFNRLVVKG